METLVVLIRPGPKVLWCINVVKHVAQAIILKELGYAVWL